MFNFLSTSLHLFWLQIYWLPMPHAQLERHLAAEGAGDAVVAGIAWLWQCQHTAKFRQWSGGWSQVLAQGERSTDYSARETKLFIWCLAHGGRCAASKGLARPDAGDGAGSRGGCAGVGSVDCHWGFQLLNNNAHSVNNSNASASEHLQLFPYLIDD